ncbi:DUF4468 domain-containing protein [Acinetobacter pittii]|uniref:DUF4468 domain-containing protein n=1 Tax=Acinetobacter pittii TaxID=48296 RepID=UPI00355C7E88
MKRIIFLALSVFSASVYAEQKPISEVVEVVELPNMKKDQIFNSSKIWIAKNFKSSNAVVQYEDIATGTIVGKGNMQLPCKGTWDCMAKKDSLLSFTLKVDTKDNKSRLTFNDMSVKINTKGTTKFVPTGQEIKTVSEKDDEVIQNGLKDIISDYKRDILAETKNTEW